MFTKIYVKLNERPLHKKTSSKKSCACQSGQIKKLCVNLNRKPCKNSHKSLMQSKTANKKETSKFSEQIQ